MAYRPRQETRTDARIARLTPPHSLEAEQSVLGALLKDAEALNRVLEVIQDARDFYVQKHQMIYQAALDLYSRSEPCDITTIVAELDSRGQLDKIGGRVYLVQLLEEIASTANAANYATIVLEKSIARKLISTSNEIVSSCYSSELPVDELLDQAESNIFRLSESRLRQGFTPLSQLISSSLEQIDNMQVADGGLAGVSTGFHELDTMTLGLHEGDLIIIAGRPSMGKTALAMNIAENIATHVDESRRKTIGIFSVEMSKDALVFRLLCSRAKLNQHKVRTGRLRDSDWPELSKHGGILSKAPIYIDDSPTLTPLELRAKARRLKSQHGLGLIVVDYIQLMHSSSRFENRQQEIANISRNLKALAKELNVPVIAISQLSRAVEQRGGEKRPQLADLRESGAIEQDADLVLLLYREEFYRSHLDRTDPKYLEVKGQADVIIAKQRNGPTGTVKLYFESELARFKNLERQRSDLPSGVEPVGGEDITPF